MELAEDIKESAPELIVGQNLSLWADLHASRPPLEWAPLSERPLGSCHSSSAPPARSLAR